MENKTKKFFPPSITLGTPQAMDFYSTWQEEPVDGIVTCYSVTTGESYVDGSSVAYITELTAGMNPRSGCQYSLIDPFKNTTAFEKDNLYNDPFDPLRYNSTSSAASSFNQTFSDINLQGNERAVAYAVFSIKESEYAFRVVAHYSETNLINFCKMQKWNYEVVGSCPL